MTSRCKKGLAAVALAAAAWLPLIAGCTSTITSVAPPAVSGVSVTAPSLSSSLPESVPSFAASTPAAASSTATSSATAPSGRGAAAPTVISTASIGTPQGAAVAWLTALRTASFRDSSSAWVQKVAPYVTPALAASYRKIAANGKGGGADWVMFVQNGCVSVLVDAAGIIPAEAPVSTAAAHVQVSATLKTVCRTGTRASSEFIAATVLVTHQHGRWAVAKREF
jgi:hypothetical protein